MTMLLRKKIDKKEKGEPKVKRREGKGENIEEVRR